MDEEILAVVEASPARRWFGVATLVGLGGLLLYVSLFTPTGAVWQFLSAALGVLVLWSAELLRRATAVRIELTQTGLRESSGTQIIGMDDIEALDRGFFAIRPSNGFLIKTKTPGPRVWRPGMWWRFGRRVGIGGVTPGAQARTMSDMLSARLAERP